MVRFRPAATLVAGVLIAGSWTSAGRAARAQAGDDLPDGEGRKILQASCTACHDLTEITKFKGYYTRDDWRDIVATMIEYGAVVKDGDREVLIDYLAKNLGKKPG